MDQSYERLKELELNRDEIEKLGEALKKEEFRKLLADYVKEIQDPENKKLYEKEITQLEKERGVDVSFVHPDPGYVIKTSIDGSKKCFINICANELIKKPSSSPSQQDGSKGLQWTLPHSLSPPIEDTDNKGERCQVFDVVFHPDTLHLVTKNKAFRSMVNNTACDAVETNFQVKLDKKNLKFPKIKYKGLAHASIIRQPSKQPPVEHTGEEKEFFDKLYAYADDKTKQYTKKRKNSNKVEKDDNTSIYTTPKYIIKHRSHVDIQDCTEHKGAKMNAAIPKELTVEINLPLLKSSTDISLDVTERTVQLVSEKPAKYKLNITLPYEVNQDNGNAKFDKDLKKLLITLPVRRKNVPILITDFSREDSGVDSDHGSPPLVDEVINEHRLISETIENETKSDEILSESDFRTNDHFLDGDISYTLPEFTCHVYDNVLTFTLDVKNVDPNSVSKLVESKFIHVKFCSISPSFYETHYAFYLELPCEFNPDCVGVETWDNNLIVQISLNNCDTPNEYSFGISEKDLKTGYVEEQQTGNIPEDVEETCDETSCEQQVVEDTKTEAINIVSYGSESSGDELSYSYSPTKSRGILKGSANRKMVERSVSESCLDDYLIGSSMENCAASLDSVIPEDAELSTSFKKTVRFSDVVSRQLYRFNSSILGQKKKNQRKAQKKKRAIGRRHSESEASEGDEKREGEIETQENSTEDEQVKERNGGGEIEKCDEKEKKYYNDIFHIDM